MSEPDQTKRTRRYRMTERHKSVEQTREDILQAAYRLWLDQPYDEMTLEGIADEAGVSRQTIYRHFGTKDELAEAVTQWRRPQDEAATASVVPGDVPGAVRSLVERYETMGDANVRTIQMADRIPALARLLERGRESHRAWVEHAFDPYLPPSGDAHRDAAVTAYYAATDVMIWKLLRRDFGRSRAQTEATIRTLVEGVQCRLSQSSEEAT